MKKLVLVLLLLIVGIVPVGAQDAELIPYTLKQVSIEDYLAALPAILSADAYMGIGDLSNNLAEYVPTDFLLRYGETATAEQLASFYSMLSDKGTHATFGIFYAFLNPEFWHERIIERWFEEHPTELREGELLHFLNYNIDVMSYMTSEGERLWLLPLRYDLNYSSYAAYWFARETANGQLDFEPLPIPYSDFTYSSVQHERWGASLIERRDLNHDGQDELTFTSAVTLPGRDAPESAWGMLARLHLEAGGI